ncbi:MAG TPA: ubiquitin-like domain-containing protein [Verrucomicrobiae bacterium]|jgi:uncharacterized protein YabE (DUF348 family)|nr:ubiquitin-like domain-containing protein [Verrucomicrobiae bacterium]
MTLSQFFSRRTIIAAVSCITAVFFGLLLVQQVGAQSAEPASGERLLAIYDQGTERGLLTRATTLREAFREARIPVDPKDLVEPGLDDRLESSNYEVNIYRARPVTIIDGETRVKVMSPYRTAKQIVAEAGMALHDEDITAMSANPDVVGQGMGVQLTITRATEFTLGLYGKKTVAYTQGVTVGDMLKEKGITLGSDDTVSAPLDAPVKTGMTIAIWRNGAQTVTEEQAIPFATQKILDMDHAIGYHEVKTAGVSGKRLVSYEVIMNNGKEVGRKKIQDIIGSQPKTQVELIGNRPVNPLSKSKGAGYFTDSQGISHRETYYDLPMGAVMGACGGGTYSVRADGAKVDQGGYILIAANYSRYPRCSVVETSMGLGKVYDTGGFAARHPDGFDLAADWTNYDGR